MERATPVVPPGKGALFWILVSKEVMQSPIHYFLQTDTLSIGVKNLTFRGFAHPAIEGRGANIEVTAHDGCGSGVVLLGKVLRERPIPVELPFVIFMVKVFSVRAIERCEIEAHYVCSDEARSEILLAGEAPGKDLGFLPTQNGHTVPCFLAVADGVVSEFLKNRMGKFFVFEFEFLESNYVGLSFREPSSNKVESSTQSIDIPCGHFHEFTPCMGSLPDWISDSQSAPDGLFAWISWKRKALSITF
jgi:hypothetical protein